MVPNAKSRGSLSAAGKVSKMTQAVCGEFVCEHTSRIRNFQYTLGIVVRRDEECGGSAEDGSSEAA
jgi:hypothetical protein